MTKLEEAARALCNTPGICFGPTGKGICTKCRGDARKVTLVLRTPTPAMIRAAYDAFTPHGDKIDPAWAWDAMVRAILHEEPR